MKQRILVVDDDSDNRTIVKLVLSRASYEVIEAENGMEAIEKAVRDRPDVILMDMSMPEMNGWEAASRLRGVPQTAQIPIIAFTAHALLGDDLKTKEAGCNDYISKPCTPKDILRKVEGVLAGGKNPQ